MKKLIRWRCLSWNQHNSWQRILRERTATVEFQRLNDEDIQVTHSITIIKSPYLRSPSMNNLSSLAGSNSTISPCSLTTREPENPWRSNKYNNNVPTAAAKKKSEKSPRAEPRSPTVYDWVVLSALEGWRVNYLADSSHYSFAIFWGPFNCLWSCNDKEAQQ